MHEGFNPYFILFCIPWYPFGMDAHLDHAAYTPGSIINVGINATNKTYRKVHNFFVHLIQVRFDSIWPFIREMKKNERLVFTFFRTWIMKLPTVYKGLLEQSERTYCKYGNLTQFMSEKGSKKHTFPYVYKSNAIYSPQEVTYIPDLKSTSILKERKLRGCDQNQKHTTCLGCQIKVPETPASDSSSIIIKIRHFIRVCKMINLRIRKSCVIKSIIQKFQ